MPPMETSAPGTQARETSSFPPKTHMLRLRPYRNARTLANSVPKATNGAVDHPSSAGIIVSTVSVGHVCLLSSVGWGRFPDTVVVVKEEMPEVFEFTGRWGTTHAHDGIWADWFTTNAIPDVLDWYGKNKIKQPNRFAKRAKLEAVKVFANKVLTSLDDAFATSDLCPQGPTGPMY